MGGELRFSDSETSEYETVKHPFYLQRMPCGRRHSGDHYCQAACVRSEKGSDLRLTAKDSA